MGKPDISNAGTVEARKQARHRSETSVFGVTIPGVEDFEIRTTPESVTSAKKVPSSSSSRGKVLAY